MNKTVTFLYLGITICALFLLAYSLDLVPSVPPPTALAETEVWEEESVPADSEPVFSQPSLPAVGAPASSRSASTSQPAAEVPASRPPRAESKPQPPSSAPPESSSEPASSKGDSSRTEPSRPSRPSVPEEPPAPSIVNLNTATEAELCTLRGIGPVLAARIIEFREACGGFSSVDELLGVNGIGDKKLAAIRDYIVAE